MKRGIVFFSEAKSPSWFLRLLPSGWRHCGIAVRLFPRRWVVIESGMCGVNVTSAVVRSRGELLRWFEANMTAAVAVMVPDASELVMKLPFGIFSCVELVKRMLGMRAILIVTPRGLHKWLTKIS